MSAYWWLTVLFLVGCVCFAFGYIVRAEFERYARAQRPYLRDLDMTHTSRSVR